MELDAVRAAYTARSQEYIDLFDRDEAAHEVDSAFITRHLGTCREQVYDLGCGPGYWTAHLHRLGVPATGVDVVPEFVAHARARHVGPAFLLGSMTSLDAPPHAAAGVLSWYSTIHLPPQELDGALSAFRRLLAPAGVLVLGHFAGAGTVEPFDHAVTTAYRWPADLLAARLAAAGFVEVERVQRQVAGRPDRRYAAIAATAV